MAENKRLEDLAGEIKVGEEPSPQKRPLPAPPRVIKLREEPVAPIPPSHGLKYYARMALYGLVSAVFGVLVYSGVRYHLSQSGYDDYVHESAQSNNAAGNDQNSLQSRINLPTQTDVSVDSRGQGEIGQPYVPPQQTVQSELAHVGEQFTQQVFNEPQQQVSQQTIDSAMDLPEEITNSIGMRLRLIPAGSFMMGSPLNEEYREPDEGPQHQVSLSAFYLGAHEVTAGQYRRFIEVTGHGVPVNSRDPQFAMWSTQLENPNRPVVNVSWDDAIAFCDWLTQVESLGNYNLPTEAQWEYACRAGTISAYAFGNSLSTDEAAFWPNAPNQVTEEDWSRHLYPVGSFPPNSWGLYDMHGNVWEWCRDWCGSDFYGKPAASQRNPENSDYADMTPVSGVNFRVSRGGSWGFDPQYCRSATRGGSPPNARSGNAGFRVIRTVERDVWEIISN